MAYRSDSELLVLHALRRKSVASVSMVATTAGLSEEDVAERMAVFADKGWVRYREGAITGWALLAAGRARGERLLAEELDAAGARVVVETGYAQFLEFNQPVLAVCTRWQLREIDGRLVPNDHSDPDYDATVVAELHTLDEAVQPTIDALSSVLDRFSGYGPRLRTAVARVEAGESDWFARPMIDSFHTVWFELHEDLLATLGQQRGPASPFRGAAPTNTTNEREE